LTTHPQDPQPTVPGGGTEPIPAAPIVARIRETLALLLAEYTTEEHNRPWICAFSGGKDSTLVLQFVFEMLLRVPPSKRTRPIHVLANDTLVESPMVAQHLDRSLQRIAEGVQALGLPVTVQKTTPKADQTFWVNLIGRGYPSPNRTFRWCTDRMKIAPTSDYIKEQVQAAGEVILLIGVRRAESSTRAASVDKYTAASGSHLNPHNDLKGCWVFRPIVDFTTEEVWELLLQRRPPWGGSHRDLITLYRNAQSGECPLVIDRETAPGCGTSSSRFGCWTCTVVDKDKSLSGFVDAGFDHLEPLIYFRDWLAAIRSDRDRRDRLRRGGQVRLMKDGSPIPGPFTLAARREILDRLLKVQEDVGISLISDGEVSIIRDIWANDEMTNNRRTVDAILEAGGDA
jgi:DNA sulfur modification protein DndC